VVPFRKSGAKKGMPWMWSQWAWVRKMSPAIGCRFALEESASELADAGAGVEDDQPASPVRSSTQGCCRRTERCEDLGSGWSRGFPRRVSVRLIGPAITFGLCGPLLQRVPVGHGDPRRSTG
jgi:hypothetical protein